MVVPPGPGLPATFAAAIGVFRETLRLPGDAWDLPVVVSGAPEKESQCPTSLPDATRGAYPPGFCSREPGPQYHAATSAQLRRSCSPSAPICQFGTESQCVCCIPLADHMCHHISVFEGGSIRQACHQQHRVSCGHASISRGGGTGLRCNGRS